MNSTYTYQEIIQMERSQREFNWRLCPADKTILDIVEISRQHASNRNIPSNASTLDIFCFDYALNTESKKLTICGHLSEEFNYQKIRLDVQGVKIYLNLEINYSISNNHIEWDTLVRSVVMEGRKEECNRTLGDIIQDSYPVSLKIFKGYQNADNEYSHLRYEFATFQDYDKFKQALFTVNQRYYDYCKGSYLTRNNMHIFKRAESKGLKNPVFKMSEDDTAKNYICKLEREYEFLLSGWNSIAVIDPVIVDGRLYAKCNIENIKISSISSQQTPLSILTWDIETATKTGKFDDNALEPLNNIICIGCSYLGPNSKKLEKFCITYLPCDGIEDDTVDLILVEDERDMLMEFAKVIFALDPSLITGFNDFNFDWPFVKGRIEFFGISKEFKDELYPSFATETGLENIFSSVDIKINASDKKTGEYPTICGSICVDTRIMLIKSEKIEKKSLNEYLKANKLPVKLDVDFKEMNRCYRDYMRCAQIKQEDNALMYHIMAYCAHDADCCRLLWEKRNVLEERLEVANLSFTPLSYSFHRADGIKVRNMVAYFAQKKKFSMPMASTSSDERWAETELIDIFGKYPGAYVPAPKKGVNTTPVIALDFASLYPSIIMAHNLSPENVLVDNKGILQEEETANSVSVTVPFEKEDKTAEIKGNVISSETEPGLYPSILRDLFARRKEVKLAIENLEKIVKAYEIVRSVQSVSSLTEVQLESLKEVENEAGLTTELWTISAEEVKQLLKIDDVKFEIELLDAKQFALKVYMNTFYGETGNSKSPFFDLIVAGGTTTFGRKYIKLVHGMVADFDCEVVYGDTDSIYLRPRASHYDISKPINTYDLIGESIEIASKIRDDVNKVVGKETNNVLKMEFEEVLCPSLFMGKKKYCGVKHTSVMEMDKIEESDILIKGIDFIKSQYPTIVKQAGYKLLISIMQKFANYSSVITTDQAVKMFKDDFRLTNNEIIKNYVIESILEFRNEVKAITPDNYDCLATRKKIREGKKGGEMILFKQRFEINTDFNEFIENISEEQIFNEYMAKTFLEIDTKEIKGKINVEELEDLGIEQPEEGEILDIVYVETFPGAKASQKMHLLEFAKQKELAINTTEYEEMFNTTAKRLLVCYFAEDDDEKVEIRMASAMINNALNEGKVLKQKNECEMFEEEIQQVQKLLELHMHEYIEKANDLIKTISKECEMEPGKTNTIKQKAATRRGDLEEESKKLLKEHKDINSLLFLLRREKEYNELCCSVNPDIEALLIEFAITNINSLSKQEAMSALTTILELVANILAMESCETDCKNITKCKMLKKLYEFSEECLN